MSDFYAEECISLSMDIDLAKDELRDLKTKLQAEYDSNRTEFSYSYLETAISCIDQFLLLV